MQLTCSQCGQVIKTLIIIKEEAAKNLGEKLRAHIREHHPTKLKELQEQVIPKVIMAVTDRLILLNFIADISNDEDFLIEDIARTEEFLRDTLDLGFDIEEEEEGEENEEQEVNTANNQDNNEAKEANKTELLN